LGIEPGVELLVGRASETLAQDGHELAARPPVHEHDEAEAELLLVSPVQPLQLRAHLRLVAVLFGRPLADARVRSERLELLLAREPACYLFRAAEWILELRKPLHERRPPAKQLGELVDGQLPR